MSSSVATSKFYFNMGLLLIGLVLAGFSAAAYLRGSSPLDMPALFHIHGGFYLLWYGLFITQASLIKKQSYNIHKTLGYTSILIVLGMLVTGFFMAAFAYERGTSPIPMMSIHQFLAFPMLDLSGLVLFYTLGILNRNDAITHKHAMLITSIAIMDPALARLSFLLGFPPFALVLHLALVGLVIFHDRKVHGKVHLITWFGLAYIIIRPIFILTVGKTEGWGNLMDMIFG